MNYKDVAIKAIQDVHTDMTKTELEENLEELQELRDEIEFLIEAIEGDIKRRDGDG